jgi:hypothetical protein
MILQNLEITNYIRQLFRIHNLKIHNCLTYFSSESLHIYISYYNLTKPSFYSEKKFKLIYKKDLSKSFKRKKSLIRVRTTKDRLYKIKFYNKELLQTRKLFQNHYLLTKKSQRLVNLKETENYLNKKTYRTLSQENANRFISKILKGINLFTKKRYNIFLNLNQINKEENILKTIEKNNKLKLRQKFLKLRKYQQNEFFRNGLNILSNFSLSGQDPVFLADFIAYYLRKLKRPTFFLRFLTVSLKILLANKFSNLSRIQIRIKGRLNRAPRSKVKSINIGKSIPIATLKAHIDYGESTAYTSNGTFGIKVWILKRNKKIQC